MVGGEMHQAQADRDHDILRPNQAFIDEGAPEDNGQGNDFDQPLIAGDEP